MAVARPCEDVIVISDAEEGELVEVEDESSASVQSQPQPIESEREEGELPDDGVQLDLPHKSHLDQIDPSPPVDHANSRKFYSVKGLNKSQNAPNTIRHNRIRFHQRSPAVHTNHFRNIQYSKNRFRRGCSQGTFLMEIPVRPKQRYRRVEESSESEPEYASKKLTSRAISRKSNKSSLKSRLSNMLKYSSNVTKRKRLKSSTNMDTGKKVESETSNGPVNGEIQLAGDAGLNDMSDEDIDILRELALKSKAQRNSKHEQNQDDVEIDTQKNNSDEGSDKNKLEVDKELEELRLDALKSAMLKKAIKRKRTKRDEKRIRKERRSVSIIDIEADLDEVACPTNSFVPPMMLEPNTENLMYDYNNAYQFYYPYYNNMRNDENNIIDPSNSNKENNEIKQNDDTEDEELLRSHLLASLDNSRKMPSACVSVETPTNAFENDADSNLIVRLGGSDTESECETTKNLTLMHKKLLVETDFQRNLEVFLKGARQTVTDKNIVKFDRNRNNNSMVMKPANQKEHKMLLERLVELEKSKLAQKQALKKEFEIQKLRKKFTYQIKNGEKIMPLNSQMRNIIIKKDAKRILRPSLLTNRKPSITLENKTVQYDNGQRALEQQLILLRKKIAFQTQAVKQIQMEMKGLQKKKEALAAQIRIATFSLNNTENSLNFNQRSIQVAHRQLILLQKQHLLLQNRCSKIAPKKNVDTCVVLNSKPKINEKVTLINQKMSPIIDNKDEAVVSNLLPETINTAVSEEKENSNKIIVEEIEMNIENLPNTHKQNIESNDENQVSNSDSNKSDSVEISVSSVSNEITIELERSDLNENSNVKLSLEIPSINRCESSSFTEYETPLLGIKSNQSWTNDPQAILCPFDVGGCCKDTSCIYFHPKM